MLNNKPYRFWRFLSLLTFGVLISPVAIASSNSGITYHGRIMGPTGIPVTDSSVQFKMQILTPDSQGCVMFQEIQSKDLSTTGGAFSITINDGTGTQTFYGYTLDQIFGNYGSFALSPAVCSSGTGTWTPNVSDGRTFLVSFKTSSMSSWEPLPTQSINFAPFAIEAKQVGGFPVNSLLRVDSGTAPQAIAALTPTQAANLIALANGTSTKYVQSSTTGGAALPTFSTNPTSPVAGDLWYDTTGNTVKYYDGSTVQTFGVSGASVTSITAGTGLSGGTITSSGTISMPNVGTAGTYTKVTTDAQGRVSSGSQITGSDITSGTIGGSTAINTTGNIQTSGNVIATNVTSVTDSTNNLKVYESTNTNAITITAPSSLGAGGYNFNLPATAGTSGQVLLSGGGGSNAMTWGTLTVSSGGTGISNGVQGGIPYFASSTTMASSAALTQHALVVGGGTSGAPSTLSVGAANTFLTGTGADPAWTSTTADTFTQYALLAGRSGGQTLYGGTGASDNLTLRSSSGGTTGYVLLQSTGGTVGVGTTAPSTSYALDVSGSVRATSGMYATGFFYTSDRRLKENIQTIENPIDKIMALRGVNFQWRETKQEDMGFIAQEVEQVLPEVMGTRPDKTFGEIKTVKYANIVALTVEAIKDLYSKWQGDHRELASLKAELDELKLENQRKNQQIEALEKRLDNLSEQKH